MKSRLTRARDASVARLERLRVSSSRLGPRLGVVVALTCGACHGFEPPPVSPRCGAAIATGAVCSIVETTNPTVSGRQVGVADIFERELPGDDGGLGMRLSAALVVHEPDTQTEAHHTVVTGTIVTIGLDGYRVTRIEAGKERPGFIVLERVP